MRQRSIVVIMSSLSIALIVIGISFFEPMQEWYRKIIILPFFLLFPGYISSFLFIPFKKLDFLQRISLAFAFSLCINALIVFTLFQFDIPIKALKVLIEISVYCLLIIFLLFIKTRITNKHR